MTEILTASRVRAIQDGDIYRWRYKDEKPDQLGAWGRYHCKSQIAIAKAGLLIDTYWGGSAGDSAHWPYEVAQERLNLTLLGNFAELERRPEYEAMYYDDADIVNINHANSSRDNFYVRKGASRSKAKMQATLLERMEQSKRERDSANRRIERDIDLLASIERGDDLNAIYL